MGMHEFGFCLPITLLKSAKALAKWYNIALQTFVFLPHPANVLSFSPQEKMLHKTLFSTSISKNVFDHDKKHFSTYLLHEQCFIVLPTSEHVKDTPIGPFDRQCAPSPISDQISRWLTMKKIAVERFIAGRSEGRKDFFK